MKHPALSPLTENIGHIGGVEIGPAETLKGMCR